METNKVSVKIYGQEYIIAGEATKEEITQVAAHVDMKMHEIADAAKAAGITTNNVAILAAVNITSEYFKHMKDIEDLKRLNIRLEKDAQHYVQMWDESKKNFQDYKAEMQEVVRQKETMDKELRAKDEEIARLSAVVAESEEKIQAGLEDAVQAVEDKCRELENSFFDLQMENLQLKKELEKYKNSISQF